MIYQLDLNARNAEQGVVLPIHRIARKQLMAEWVWRTCKGILPLAVVGLAMAMPGVMAAQAAATPEFEVATIKPSDPNKPGGMMGFDEDKFMTRGQTLKAMIKFAYNLNFGTDQQISGGPSWVGSAKFDVQAKEDAETAAALQKLPGEQRMATIRPMLQALLVERFKLKVHHETKELPIYEMTVVKSGLKMTPSVDAPVAVDGSKPAAPKGWHGLQVQGRGKMEGRGAGTEMLSNVLGMQPEIGGRMVVDKTGLTGRYDFMLKWTPDEGLGSASTAYAGAPTDTSGPSLFTALQEELGLKLEGTKGSVDTIVIDSVEMPSEN
jgi:uncharacterized protein (TIGR03435 family)